MSDKLKPAPVKMGQVSVLDPRKTNVYCKNLMYNYSKILGCSE